MKTKALQRLKITDESEGKVQAVFATLGAIDSDGDVTLKGAFTDGAKVRISAYNHASWGPGQVPVGKGEIREEGDEAILDGEFFLETEAGRDTFIAVKELGELAEWSYGYDVDESEEGEQDGSKVRFLKGLTVHEVSPVILGAGVNTRTLAMKAAAKELQSNVFQRLRDAGRERWGDDGTYVYADDFDVDESWAIFAICPEDDAERSVRVDFTRAEDGSVTLGDEETEVQRTTSYAPKGKGRGLKLSEHITAVIADVDALNTRVAEVMARRAEKGKGLGDESAEQLTELRDALQKLDDHLVAEPNEALLRERARAERHRATV